MTSLVTHGSGTMLAKFRPNNLFLNVSLSCNMKCGRCYGHLDAFAKADMGLDVAKRATDLFFAHRNQAARDPYVMLFGGEPLLNWRMVEDYLPWLNARYPERTYDRFLFTNAVLLTPARAEFLIEQGVTLYVSLDGDYDVYRRVRPVRRGEFDHVVEMIRYCERRRHESAIPHCVIRREELADTYRNLAFAASLGVELITVARDFMQVWSEADRERLHEVLRRVRREYDVGFLVYPEATVSCPDCAPTSIMVYPDGRVFDLCYVFGTILVRRHDARHEELDMMCLGTLDALERAPTICMDVERKRGLMQGRMQCPSVSSEFARVAYLER